jgi:hypothetical protein
MNRMGSYGQRGMSPLGILFLIVILILFLLLCDEAYILNVACKGSNDALTCALNMLTDSSSEQPPPQGSVTASGVIAGEFQGESHSVTVHMTFPLEGGAVTGNFSGDCEGTLSGTFAGGNGGAISGSGNGSCAFVIPASGTFSGSVNTSGKTVNINGTGSAAGQSQSGSLTLTY